MRSGLLCAGTISRPMAIGRVRFHRRLQSVDDNGAALLPMCDLMRRLAPRANALPLPLKGRLAQG
jgi:hypothetical protein